MSTSEVGTLSEVLNTRARQPIPRGLTEAEITEAITDLAFYAGWPKAMSAVAVIQKTFGN